MISSLISTLSPAVESIRLGRGAVGLLGLKGVAALSFFGGQCEDSPSILLASWSWLRKQDNDEPIVSVDYCRRRRRLEDGLDGRGSCGIGLDG